MEIEREKDVLTHTAAEIARYSLDEETSQIAAPIREKLEQFRSAIKQGTVSPKTKRIILEQFVESVTIHLKKGSPLHWTVREVMPFRSNMTETFRRIKRQPCGQETGQPSKSPRPELSCVIDSPGLALIPL